MGSITPATMFLITAGVSAGASLYQGYTARQALKSDIARYEEEKKLTAGTPKLNLANTGPY